MRSSNVVKQLLAGQYDLGPFLRFESLVSFTILVFVAGGGFLTLPPGPLCDEGMVLFMEGGCDYGESNIFFFAKVSLLGTANLALFVAWKRSPDSWSGFLPHLALLGLMAWVYRSGGHCDTYYSHPNGSIGQMTLEMACFAILGVALGRALAAARWRWRAAAAVAWNALHVGAFYLFLKVAAHWTWQHTGQLGGFMVAIALLLWRIDLAVVAAEERPAGAETTAALTWRQSVSVLFIAGAFGLIANPFGLAPMAVLCTVIGLSSAWLVGRVASRRTARVAAVVLALVYPAFGLMQSTLDYQEQRHRSDLLLDNVAVLTLADAELLKAAALALRRDDGAFDRIDLVESSPAVREIAERVLGIAAALPRGTILYLLVPLDGKSYARLYWSRGGPCGDVLEQLETEHSYLRGRELIKAIEVAGRTRSTPWRTYVVETALRWSNPGSYAGAPLVGAGGQVQALLFADMIPLRFVNY